MVTEKALVILMATNGELCYLKTDENIDITLFKRKVISLTKEILKSHCFFMI